MRHPGGAPPSRGCPGLPISVSGLRVFNGGDEPTHRLRRIAPAFRFPAAVFSRPESAGVHPLLAAVWGGEAARSRPERAVLSTDVARVWYTRLSTDMAAIRTSGRLIDRHQGGRAALGKRCTTPSDGTSIIWPTILPAKHRAPPWAICSVAATSPCRDLALAINRMIGQTSTDRILSLLQMLAYTPITSRESISGSHTRRHRCIGITCAEQTLSRQHAQLPTMSPQRPTSGMTSPSAIRRPLTTLPSISLKTRTYGGGGVWGVGFGGWGGEWGWGAVVGGGRVGRLDKREIGTGGLGACVAPTATSSQMSALWGDAIE